MERPLALVVDGDSTVHALVREVLDEKDATTLGVSTAAEAMDVLHTRGVSVLVADLEAPGVVAGDLLAVTRRLRPTAAIAVLAPRADEDAALAALRNGAADVLGKPFGETELRLMLERAVAHADLLGERHRLRERLREEAGYERIVGRSAPMERLRERLHRVASSDENVLLVGEEGVGKELVARTLHGLFGDGSSFIAVDCRATSAAQLPTELDALLRGAAESDGVLYLDSVLDLSHHDQDRLAAALRDGGPNAGRRVLASASGDPLRAAEEGRFNEELRRRLGTVTLEIPPLRARQEDIPLLARHFIESIREINNLPPIRLTAEALEALHRYAWPGNVRELRNVIEQAVILESEGTIRTRDLPERVRVGQPIGVDDDGPSLRTFKAAKREVVEAFERRYLRDVLERHGGNVTAAAQQAGMLRSALQRLLRKHDIRSAEYRRRRGQTDREL